MHELTEMVEEMPVCPFKIKDRVMTKRLGFPAIGTVVGILPTFIMAGQRPITSILWDKLYPSWDKGFVINVVLDDEQKPYTFEEFKELAKPDLSDDFLKESYRKEVPLIINNMYPMDDLELVE